MQIFDENDLLDPKYRKHIIEEIESPENTQRKSDSYKRYEIYRDRMKKYILEDLTKELDAETIKEMQSRISTINIYKKMVQKKARVYKDTPIRMGLIEGDEYQDYIDSLSELLNLNTTMKKVNRYVEAFRNCCVYVKPYKDHMRDGKYSYMLSVLAPHQFDVIEDQDNPEIVRAVVLSHHKNQSINYAYDDPQSRTKNGFARNFRSGDGKNQTIADSPADMGDSKEYIFWSKNHHFTCDEKGNIISKDEIGVDITDNPIDCLPFVFFSKDQDGAFWSVGGEDIIDGSVLINTLLTDLYFIAKIQGMGLFYLFGKNVPKTFKVGPNRAVTMEVEEGDPTPQIGFANSSPPLESHMRMVEQYIALLLSTNDLSTNSIQGKLDASSAASGIQEIIQNAEPMTAIEDEQEQYRDKEPEILKIANKWQQVYLDSATGLTDAFSDIGSVDDVLYAIKFEKPTHFNSPIERLNAVKMKIDQGIYNKVDAMIDDNPDLSREDALQLLLEKAEENVQLMVNGFNEMINNNSNNEDEDGESTGADNQENKPQEVEQDQG